MSLLSEKESRNPGPHLRRENATRGSSQDCTDFQHEQEGSLTQTQRQTRDESEAGGKRTRQRAKKMSRPVPERKKAVSQPSTLYIRIHDVINDIGVLGGVLTAKVNTPGMELTPTETCIKRSGDFTFCTLTCDSKALAKKLRTLILKDRAQFTPVIDCSFDDFLPAELQRQRVLETKMALRKKVENEFAARSEQVVRNHEQKIVTTQEKIDKVKAQWTDRNLYTLSTNLQEIEALEYKLQELQKQKQVFMSALNGFRQKLDILLMEEKYENEIQALRKQLGIECCRLEKALPMYARRDDVVDLVRQHPVSVLLAETGSGKSTQVVQYLCDAGFASTGAIVCTQPRKVAAVSLATHVAQEMATNVGKDVGYKAGSRNKTSPSTKVVYMTDHTLLNQCLTDPDFKQFSCIVVDEAHERSLFTDLLLTMVKRCLARRPDLRVIITSATIDPQVFVRFFGSSCPVMRVSGRTFPVEVNWQDSATEQDNDFENYVDAALNKAMEIHDKEPSGDILVFLTSAAEIQKCCDTFEQKMTKRADFKCFQLHGQLQADEQQKVFEPLEKNKRKIVFATNCAETSITIDGIKYVVDTGVAKEMRYDPKRNMRSLAVTIISQSSAEQRKGRAGRTAPGKCYRLYSQHSYQKMETISLPEILKTHLGHALLKLAEFGVTPDMYDFVQSPSEVAIDSALKTLHQLGAMHNNSITDTGRWIARLPFDPKLGLMTLYGQNRGLIYDTIVLASLITAGSGLFYRGLTDEEHAKFDKSKLQFSHRGGDSLTSMEVYKTWHEVPEKQKSKWCVDNAINAKVVRGVRETVNDICKLLKNDLKMEVSHKFSEGEGISDKLRMIVFECSLSNICHFLGREKAGYFAVQASKQVHIHPSSALCSLSCYPEWVVYDQLLQTTRDFVTGVTPVDEAWVLDLKKEQCGFDVEQIRKKQLLNVFTQPAGSYAFSAIVGPRFTNLRQLQENCVSEPSSVVTLEGKKETGEVKVFSIDMENNMKTLIGELGQIVSNAVKELGLEVREEAVGIEKLGMRVLLGQGAQIIEILMPQETRKIFVTKPSTVATEETIKQKFQAFGEISFCHQFPASSGGQNWGFIVFRTVTQAVAAVEATKDDEHDIAELERRRQVKDSAEFKARLSWNRRRAKGFGFVKVSPAYISQFLTIKNLYIGNSIVKVKMDRKNENSLYLNGLPADVTEDLIQRTLLHEIGNSENASGIVENVSVPRQPLDKTDKKELKRLEDQIKATFQQHLSASKVRVVIFPPKTEKTAMFSGQAFFSDPIEGLAACKTLRLSFVLAGTKVEVEPIISATIRVSKAVFLACKVELKEVMAGRLKDMGVEVDIKYEKRNNLIILKADDTEDLVLARTFVNNIIQGYVLDCSNNPTFNPLLTSAGHEILNEAQRETGAYISVSYRLRTVSIHGSVAASNKVLVKINEYLDQVLSGTEEEVMLRGEGRAPGLLKTLYIQFGQDLDGLRVHAGLHSIFVNYSRQLLKLTGPLEGLKKAKQVVEEVERTLWESSSQSPVQDDDSIDCSACFCPIEKGDLYRTEICAHPFCTGCIVHQVSIAVKEHTGFPITCCHENCDLPLAWRDFNNLTRLGHLKIPDLATSALSAYVQANRDKARFCTTPDCPIVYRVTSEKDAEAFTCPECDVRTCTGCHRQAHDGMTCSMFRSSKTADHGVEDWVKKDPKNRMACPGCKSPIEKISGCNKMRCSACGVVFCWVCGKKFPTTNECYDHLAREHKGIFDREYVMRFQ